MSFCQSSLSFLLMSALFFSFVICMLVISLAMCSPVGKIEIITNSNWCLQLCAFCEVTSQYLV